MNLENNTHNCQEFKKIIEDKKWIIFDVLKLEKNFDSEEYEFLSEIQKLLFIRIKQYFPQAKYHDLWATSDEEIKNLLDLNWKDFKIVIQKLFDYNEFLP